MTMCEQLDFSAPLLNRATQVPSVFWVYAYGQGLRQDFICAYMWLSVAAIGSQGHDVSTTIKNQDYVASQMTAAQLGGSAGDGETLSAVSVQRMQLGTDNAEESKLEVLQITISDTVGVAEAGVMVIL